MGKSEESGCELTPDLKKKALAARADSLMRRKRKALAQTCELFDRRPEVASGRRVQRGGSAHEEGARGHCASGRELLLAKECASERSGRADGSQIAEVVERDAIRRAERGVAGND